MKTFTDPGTFEFPARKLFHYFPVIMANSEPKSACIICGDEPQRSHFTCKKCTEAINRENSMDKITQRKTPKKKVRTNG